MHSTRIAVRWLLALVVLGLTFAPLQSSPQPQLNHPSGIMAGDDPKSGAGGG
jgi:hypothetical protein